MKGHHLFPRPDGNELYLEYQFMEKIYTLSLLAIALIFAFKYKKQLAGLLFRGRANSDFKDREAFFRSFSGNFPDACFMKDPQGYYLAVNPAFTRMIGKSEDQILGKSYAEIFSHTDTSMVNSMDEKVTSDGEPYQMEHTLKLNSEERTFLVTLGPVIGARGNIIAIFGISCDITYQRQQEQERQNLHQQLAQAQKMESLGQLAGGVAHDFNNLLSAIMLNLTILQDMEEAPSESRLFLDEISESVDRAANLIRQMLLFSRRSVAEFKTVDLNSVIEHLLKMLSRLIGEDVCLDFQRSDTPACIIADTGMLEQIILNLALNSRDAMPNGGTIRITTSERDFENYRPCDESSPRNGSFVCLQVSDDGEGMEDSVIEHLFEPFFTTKESGKGTGLGLATVHGIVAQHKGWIEVESEPGKGSCFKIYFPKCQSSLLFSDEDTLLQASTGSGTILLVEDEAPVRMVMNRALKRLGYRTLLASNANEALKIWKSGKNKVDLLFTDMVMPGGMTGLDLANRIRLEDPDLGIIISSGYNNEITAPSRLPAENMSYLSKPFRLNQLADSIQQILMKEPLTQA